MLGKPAKVTSFGLLGISVVAVGLGLLSYNSIVRLREARACLRKTYVALNVAGDLGIALRDAERGQRGFLLTGRDTYLTPYYEGTRRAASLQDNLLRLTADNPSQQERLRALAPVIQRKLEELAQTVELKRSSSAGSALSVVDADVGLRLMGDIEAGLDGVQAEERRLFIPRSEAADRADARITQTAVGGAGVVAALIGLGAWFLAWAQRVQRHQETRALLLLDDRTQAEAAVRESETRLRDLIGTLDLASVFVRAADGTIRFWSQGCEQLYGWTAEEALGRRSHDLLGTEFPIPLIEIEAALRRDGGWSGDLVQRRRDGSAIMVAARWVIPATIDGGAERVMESVADVTALRQARAELQGLNKDLEARVMTEVAAREAAQARAAHAERMQALGQLAGGIAHDINNVLQAVQGGASLIARQPDDIRAVRHFSRLVLNAAERGSAVTKRLLGFARQSDLRPEALDPTALLEELREILIPTLGSGLDIQINAQADLPSLLADKGQLETVLVNLATNARDAMAGFGTLTLSASGESLAMNKDLGQFGILKAAAYVRLSVSDTGSGMDAAILARVTEPFFSTKAPGKGTGLGLAMARGFAEQSCGLLHIESAPGAGTAVSLWLPVAPIKTAWTALPDHQAGAGMETRGARLLVVDDDDLVREIVAQSLEDAGYAVVSAASGAEALVLLDTNESVDLLVSDLTMPGMDGLTLIREAQQRRQNLPAILLTGFADTVAKLAAKDAINRPFSLLRKPIETRALVERIELLLEKTESV